MARRLLWVKEFERECWVVCLAGPSASLRMTDEWWV
jgi:hypothetical protein